MISPSDYKTVTDYIGSSEDQKTEILYNFYLIYTQSYQATTTNVSNYPTTYGNMVYQQYINYIPTSSATSTMVATLQSHIYNNYGDVNTFLQSNAIKVSQSFAKLSAETGWTITSGNIV